MDIIFDLIKKVKKKKKTGFFFYHSVRICLSNLDQISNHEETQKIEKVMYTLQRQCEVKLYLLVIKIRYVSGYPLSQ